MIVTETIERLNDYCGPTFRLIKGAAELASLGTARPTTLPALFVFIAEEAAAGNERINGVLQRTEVDLSVVLVTGNVSDPRGAAAAADIEALKTAARAALIGWQPASADDVMTYVGGRLVRARDGLVWWELTFATAMYLEG